eukprot:Pgem_evm1s9724
MVASAIFRCRSTVEQYEQYSMSSMSSKILGSKIPKNQGLQKNFEVLEKTQMK